MSISSLCFAQTDSIVEFPSNMGLCGTTPEKIFSYNEKYFDYRKGEDSTQGLPINERNFLTQNDFPSQYIVICGTHFRVFFDDFNHLPLAGFADPVTGQNRRNTLCEVLQYIENTLSFANMAAGGSIDIFVDRSFSPSFPAPVNTGWLAIAGPYYDVPLNQQGVYSGNMFNHITSGIDPDPINYDAFLCVNFDQYYHFGSPNSIQYWTINETNPTNSCQFDLYSVLLHEVTHQLGWLSLIEPDINDIATQNTNSFSLFDWTFLYQGDVTNPSGFQKIVIGATPQLAHLSSNNVSLIQNNIWLNNLGSPRNHPVFSGCYEPSYNQDFDHASLLSHMNYFVTAFPGMAQFSPGFLPQYVMGPSFNPQEMRRSWTLAELRALHELGYDYDATFGNNTTLNGTDINITLLNTNSPAYRIQNTNIVSQYGVANFPELQHIYHYFTPTVQNPTYTINITTDPDIATWDGLSDLNNDPITIMENSLFGIRGVSDGTNSHARLSINAARTEIIYTPEPGYIGKAQFGFNLWDGHERGALVIYTVQVEPNPQFTVAAGSELVINGTFEDGIEVRQKNSLNSGLPYSSNHDGFIEGEYYQGYHVAGAHPFSYRTNSWNLFGGDYILNSEKACFATTTPPTTGTYGYYTNTSNTSYVWGNWLAPLPNQNTLPNERFEVAVNWGPPKTFADCYLFSTLKNEVQQCSTYTFECDLAFNVNYYTPGQAYEFYIVFTTDPGTNPQSASIIQSIPFTVDNVTAINGVNGTLWQHFTGTFNYCGSVPSRFFKFAPALSGPQGGVFVDNLSIKQTTPLPLSVTVTGNSNICPGIGTSLTALTSDAVCTSTYSWSTGATGATINVAPLTTTTYTVTATDCYRSATETYTITVSPIIVTAMISYDCQKIVGSIDQKIECGVPPYTYLWSNNATTQDLLSVSGGTYSVTITDGNGQQYVYTYTLINPLLPPDLGQYPSSSCGQGQTYLYTIQNPDPNMSYSWSVDPPTAGTASAVPPNGVSANITWTLTGTANIVIHATNSVSGCSGDFNFEVNEPCDNPPTGNFYFCNENSLPVLASYSTHTGEIFVVNGAFTINSSNLTFTSCKFFMGPLASIQIDAGITTHFDGCFFLSDSADCRHMWDGIYVTSSNSLAEITDTKIWDAINGLVSKNGGQITQSNDYLKRNYKCVQVMDYTPPAGSNINVTMSKCTLLGVASLPYPPYTGNSSYLGMGIKNIGAPNNTNGIIVGNAGLLANRNVFKDLSVAMNIEQSNVTVYNNKFTYSLGTAPTSLAIVDYGTISAPFSKYTTIIGSTTTNYPNLFENYKTGVQAGYGMDLTITGNTLTGCTNSIYFRELGENGPVQTIASITRNIITNGLSTGVWAAANPNCNANISCNTITMATNNANTAIAIIGSDKTNTNEIYNVNFNTISALFGIVATKVYSIVIKNSPSLKMQNNNTGSASYGIAIIDCDNQYVRGNAISGVTTARTNKYGICINSTTHPFYWGNSIKDAAVAFGIVGTNSNNLQTVSIKQNSFTNCDIGMFKNAGTIGQQGNASVPWYNKWNSVAIHTGGTGNNDFCWSRNIGYENFIGQMNLFTNQQSCTTTCPPGAIPAETCSPILPLGGLGQSVTSEISSDVIDPLGASSPAYVLQNELISNSNNFDEVISYMAKQSVYAQLLVNKSLYMQDAGFASFITSSDNNSIGLLYKADLMIGRRKADSAISYNEQVVTTNIADSLHKVVNAIYITYIRIGKLATQEMEQLRSIATLCPLTYGDGVYIARALLNISDSIYVNYSNLCETIHFRSKNMVERIENDDAQSWQIDLYPNPAGNQLTIECSNSTTDAFEIWFEVYDLMGKKLLSHAITANQVNTVNTEMFMPGVYYYRFTNKDKTVFRDKLIIIK